MKENFQRLKLKQYRFRRKIINGIQDFLNWWDKIPYYFNLKKAVRRDMPDFIIAGLPKCGTVWMVRVLRTDSQFQYIENPFFPNKGELRFFSRNFHYPIKEYFNAFNRDRNLSKLAYEKSPDYSTLSKRRIKLIKKLNPKIKIILIFRHPIERAFSNAKMDLFRTGIKISPKTDESFFSHYKNQSKIYNYQRILTNWNSIFTKSQVLLLSQEDIGEHPEKVIATVYKFLERPSNFDHDLGENPNKSDSKLMPESHRVILNKYLQTDIEFWSNNKRIFRL